MRGRAWTLGFLAASGAYLAMALTFPLGTVAKPGPGFFPVGVGVFLCLAAAVLIIAGLRPAPAGAPVSKPSRDERARVMATVAGLVGFCLLMPWLGYPACAFLFVALLLRRLGGSAWPGVVITAALSALLTHYVFGVLLGVPLPRGPF
jgi:Tripartite tricarboxylate transporter TctB family